MMVSVLSVGALLVFASLQPAVGFISFPQPRAVQAPSPGLPRTSTTLHVDVAPSAILEQASRSRALKRLTQELNRQLASMRELGKRAGFMLVFASGSAQLSRIAEAVAAAGIVVRYLPAHDPVFAEATGLGYWGGSGSGFVFRIFFLR